MLKNNKGFTLIEMLIVLLIISVLIIIIVPNLGDQSKGVNETGCEALKAMVQAQVDAYYIEHKEYPTWNELKEKKYVKEEQETCPNGEVLSIDGETVSSKKADE